MPDCVKIIWNPISGSGITQKLVPMVVENLKARGLKVDSFRTSAQGDARDAAAAAPVDLHALVSVGGDGTLNEVLNGLGSTEIPLAVFPAGTGNVFWHEIMTPKKDVDAFCNMIEDRRVRRFDVGTLGDRRFLCMAGAGLDAFVVRSLESFRWGNMHISMYVFPITRSLLDYGFPPIVVEVDGRIVTRRGGTVIVGNTKAYGGPIDITSKALPYDGQLDVCIYEGASLPDMIKHFMRTVLKQHTCCRGIKYLKGTRVRMFSDCKVPLQVDGDSSGFLPAEVGILPEHIPIILQKGNRMLEEN